MNNENDMKFNIITECANKILSFQADLKEVDLKEAALEEAALKEEKEQLKFSISEQEQLIKEYTDTPIDYILRYVEKINEMKQKLITEQIPENRKILENTINTYSGFIKSKIKDEPLIGENSEDAQNKSITTGDEISSDKCAQYRTSQKYDLELLKLAKDVSKMCEEHQLKLKAAEQRKKEASRKRIIITMNNEYF